jgi:glycosyltransferase involved in cell wall biosynthesis
LATLTESIWPIIARWDGLRDRPDVVHEVVPCCADLDLFQFSDSDREIRRRELGVSDRFVVVYSGSIDGWYLTERMADFFAALLKQRPDAHFLWLTPARHERIRHLMRERRLNEGSYTVMASSSRDVPSYLSASDAGLAFIKPCLSKLASSPTKYAEYLGCGLPLIINSGIGDSDA